MITERVALGTGSAVRLLSVRSDHVCSSQGVPEESLSSNRLFFFSAIGGPPYSLQVGNDSYGELKPISTIPRADSLCPSPKPDERL